MRRSGTAILISGRSGGPRPGRILYAISGGGGIGHHGQVSSDPGYPYSDFLQEIRCGQCGRGGGARLAGWLVGCGKCGEFVTRHRCTGRPDIATLDAGTSWECADCGTTWIVTGKPDPCRECGRGDMKSWSHAARPARRLSEAPRYRPPVPASLLRWDKELAELIRRDVRTLAGVEIIA